MAIPLQNIKSIIPPLNGTLHKGQSGRVGILGGAREYTGAPYFAAISALRLGADLSHIICDPNAATPIKSYSPDIIVHPTLDPQSAPKHVESELQSILSRLHVLIIGPGLGRESHMKSYALKATCIARNLGIYILYDADALDLISQTEQSIQGYHSSVITPNINEFNKLIDRFAINVPDDKKAISLSKALGGVTVLQKGAQDIIAVDTTTDNNPDDQPTVELIKLDIPGGLKRCGGQGDVLSGLVGTMLAWGKCYQDGIFGDNTIPSSRIPFLAAIGGSIVTRTASRSAFYQQGRGVVTQDIIPEISKSMQVWFGQQFQAEDEHKL